MSTPSKSCDDSPDALLLHGHPGGIHNWRILSWFGDLYKFRFPACLHNKNIPFLLIISGSINLLEFQSPPGLKDSPLAGIGFTFVYAILLVEIMFLCFHCIDFSCLGLRRSVWSVVSSF